jgi:G3E family GTPase
MNISKKVPVTIVTGFLGTGKTTLINALIKRFDNKKLGIIINEFGEVGVDSELVKTTEELKIEISNGCVCCVVRTDLEEAVFEMLKNNPDIDNLIIEASGLSEAEPIVQTFLHNITLNKDAYLDGVVCLIDAKNFVKDLEAFETLKLQIAHSDMLVLSKISESENPETIKELLHKMRPEAKIFEFVDQNSKDLSLLLETGSYEDLLKIQISNDHGHEHHDHHDQHDHQGHNHDEHSHNHSEHHHKHEHEDFDEVVFTTQNLLDGAKLDEIYKKEVFANVIRAKGFLQLQHQPETTFVFQQVGHGRQISPYHQKIEGNRLVFIGKKLDKEEIINQLDTCKV